MWSWNFDTVNKAVINISCCGDEERQKYSCLSGPGRIRLSGWLCVS